MECTNGGASTPFGNRAAQQICWVLALRPHVTMGLPLSRSSVGVNHYYSRHKSLLTNLVLNWILDRYVRNFVK